MSNWKLIFDILPFLIPIILIELILLVVALVDVVKREKVRCDNKIIWVLIILFFSIVGPIIYLTFGRWEKPYFRKKLIWLLNSE